MHEYNLVNLETVNGISRPDELEKIKQNIVLRIQYIIVAAKLQWL
jgi:hypothetical protein